MTTDPQMAASAAVINPGTGVGAVVNPPPAGYAWRYTRTGIPIPVPIEHASELEAEFQLRAERFDLDECYADWKASQAAIEPVVDDCVRELKEHGCIRDEVYDVLNQAMGTMVDRYRTLMAAVGASLPTEAQIVSIREHLDENGSLDRVPALRKYEDHARALPAERVEVHRQRRAAADALANT